MIETKIKPRSTQSARSHAQSETGTSLALRSLRPPRLNMLFFVLLLSVVSQAQTPAQPRQVFRSGTELVLVNVVVRDKTGAVVRRLTRDDFTVTEDDKPQTITSFDFEELDKLEAAAEASPGAPVILPPKPAAPVKTADATPAATPAKVDMRGRRLIVRFFDLSSMQPEELERAAKAAHDYVDKKLSPADLIAVASFS